MLLVDFHPKVPKLKFFKQIGKPNTMKEAKLLRRDVQFFAILFWKLDENCNNFNYCYNKNTLLQSIAIIKNLKTFWTRSWFDTCYNFDATISEN